jgi:hypothetical protein
MQGVWGLSDDVDNLPVEGSSFKLRGELKLVLNHVSVGVNQVHVVA